MHLSSNSRSGGPPPHPWALASLLAAEPLRRHLVRTVRSPPPQAAPRCRTFPYACKHKPMCNACMCMHGGGLLSNHHSNSNPQKCLSSRLSTDDASASQNAHNATTTPPIANTYQIANTAQSCNQKCCMLTNHPPPCMAQRPFYVTHVPFAEFAHKPFQVKRVCNPNTDRLVCNCTDYSLQISVSG